MTNYPPGFGGAHDLDHVEGPVSQEEIVDELCSECHETRLIRLTWHGGKVTVECQSGCNYYREEDPHGGV